jgi:predicted transcriptional regulator
MPSSTEAAQSINPFDDVPFDLAPEALTLNERKVFQALWTYSFDSEAIVYPSQARLAKDVGVSRQTVNQIIGRLINKRWVKMIDKRWAPSWTPLSGPRRWMHNVYELLQPPLRPISDLVAKRITRRAHRARKPFRLVSVRVSERVAQKRGRICRCKHCRVDYASVRKPPPLIRPRSALEQLLDRHREKMIKRFGYVSSERYGL